MCFKYHVLPVLRYDRQHVQLESNFHLVTFADVNPVNKVQNKVTL